SLGRRHRSGRPAREGRTAWRPRKRPRRRSTRCRRDRRRSLRCCGLNEMNTWWPHMRLRPSAHLSRADREIAMMTKKLYLAGVIVGLLTLLFAAVVPSAPQADERAPRANEKHPSPTTGPLAYALAFDGSVGQFGILDIGSGVFSVIADLPDSGQGLA